jgi:hypothetical protein
LSYYIWINGYYKLISLFINCWNFLIHAIVNSKLDCVYVVNNWTQYLTNPSPSHIQITKRILCYIKGTSTLGITYQQLPNGDILHGFSNVDWASDKNTCRFTFGYYFILPNGVISWGNKMELVTLTSNSQNAWH